MNDDMYFYEPTRGHGLPHEQFNAIVASRPICSIASHDHHGTLNLAPYSYLYVFNYRPPIIGFASVGFKDSLRNIQESKEFVWNLATHDLAPAMNQSFAMVAP